MKKVFIHIGHGKTGTSATQTALARIHGELLGLGYCYPEHPSFARAAEGRISSGNLDGSRRDWFDEQLLPAVSRENSARTLIFSNENLFWQLESFLNSFSKVKNEIDFHIILAVRDPFEMLSSAYMQAVKRGGYTGSISEYSKTEGHITQAAQLVEAMKLTGVNFTLLNYSTLKGKITETIFKTIGIKSFKNIYDKKNLGVVNRSLSPAELQAVILINQIFGRAAGASTSDRLVEKLPNIKSDLIQLSSADAQDFKIRVQDAVDYLNQILNKQHQLKLDIDISENNHASLLSAEQIEVIKEALENRILLESDASFLYGAALSFENQSVLSRQHSVKLLQLARRAMPKGPLIRQKIQEYISAVDKESVD